MRWTLLLLIPLLAGCLQGDEAPRANVAVDDEVTAAAELFLAMDHDHHDASLHAVSHNLDRVGYNNGFDNSGSADNIPNGMYYTELATWGDYAFLARANVESGLATPLPCGNLPNQNGIPVQHGGFSIINLADPANPWLVGTYEAPPGSDIEVSNDGNLVFFSTQRNCPHQLAGVLQAEQDPSDVLPRGVHVVDVSDPTAPELAFYLPLPVNGPHTVSYSEVRNRELLFVSTYDLYEAPGGELQVVSATQRVYIYEVQRDPAGGTDNAALRLINTFFLTGGSSKLVFPHDAIHQTHPDTLQELLYVAYWDKGVQIVDITNLEGPLSVTDEFTDFSPSSRNNIHQVRPFDQPIAGKHITVAEPEIISADETGYITFIDTSDPTDVRKAGVWTLPGDLLVRNFDFSPHNFVLGDGKVFLAHNHAGIWVIDAGSEADLADPKSVGYFLDVEPRTGSPIAQPWFWGTMWSDGGYLLASDQSSGLYVLQYTGP